MIPYSILVTFPIKINVKEFMKNLALFQTMYIV